MIGVGQGNNSNIIDLPNKKEEKIDISSSQLYVIDTSAIDTSFQEEISKSAVMSLPYPIIFIHGLNGTGESWSYLCSYYNAHCNWSWGGEIEFCLEMYDSPGVRQDKCDLLLDVHRFTSNVPSADYYRIEFDCNSSGNCHITNGSANASLYNSNQAAVIKQGKAIGIAIDKVLNATGKNKVILVGHSMGGLAAREYIQNSSHWLTGSHRVAKLVTSGTPHSGSNFSGFGTGVFLNFDEESEAVRDLRKWYYYSYDWGVYLWGGLEYQNGSTHMDDNINWANQDFRNVDVNCNEVTLESITALNSKSMPLDIDYACIYGDSDGIVDNSSSNLYNVYSYLTRLELMKCTGCAHSEYEPANTCLLCNVDIEPRYRTFKALDEPDYLDLAYKVDAGGGWYNGYLTYQDVNHPISANSDDDTYYFYNNTLSNILIYVTDLPSNSSLKVYNSSSSTASPIATSSSNSGTISLDLNNLSSGNYYIKISTYNPYGPNDSPWDFPYRFYISSYTISSINESSSTERILVKKTDVLGRETNQTNQPLFYIYNDGTVEKRIVVE